MPLHETFGQVNAPKAPIQKRSALMEFLQPIIDNVNSIDPGDILSKILGSREAETPMLKPIDPNYISPSSQLGDPLTDMMNRQGNIKKTFGKIPGKK